ncbi:MAG: MBL fold metallo-hydrolase [Burkholderiaceae bacterium]|nr:MBL fold metallo-hydrolase [Burkholderiaceae bacterium]
MRFRSLGSGSEGNALLIECGARGAPLRILVDCGFGVREIIRRLAWEGLAPGALDAILVTHEHGDHIGGVARLSINADAPLYMTDGTARAAAAMAGPVAELRIIDAHEVFEIAGVRIEPIAVPHDAREPVQFVIDDGRARLGVLTDIGRSTAHVVRALGRLDALVLECNHDAGMLESGSYPRALKQRIGGGFGHLSNTQAGEILAAIDQDRLRAVVAAHLSRSNNRAELAREALARAWGVAPEVIGVADQDNGFAWIDL